MNQISGRVISTKTKSPSYPQKQFLEIELEQKDTKLLDWQNRQVIVRKI